MSYSLRLTIGLWAVMILSRGAPAVAQRIQFPSQPPDAGWPTAPPASTGLGAAWPDASAWPRSGAPPSATFQGTIQPAPSASGAFDPYADPALSGQAPYSPYAPNPYAPPPNASVPPGYTAQPPALEGQGDLFAPLREPMRFLQELRFRYTWLEGDSAPEDFELNDLELSGTFAMPLGQLQAPLLITPGFAVHYLEGPVTSDPLFADLPPRVYDAYLDAGWNPQLTETFAMSLGARVGVYSDFQVFDSHTIRIMGRGLGILGLSPTVQLALGVVYVDRLDIKLLPAGGIIWVPDQDTRFEILFPNPKLAKRLTTIGTTEIWGYLAGELGGGSWTVERVGGDEERVDYNDIRVLLGFDAVTVSGWRWMFEVGFVFNREIIYEASSPHEFDPDETFMLRAGLAF